MAKNSQKVSPYHLYQYTQKENIKNISKYALVSLYFQDNEILIYPKKKSRFKEIDQYKIHFYNIDMINSHKSDSNLKEPEIVLGKGLGIQQIQSIIY